MGYRKIKERTRNDAAIFKKGKSYISRDVDSHNGGAWKEASSPKKLNRKETRNGTFDKNLNRIGDTLLCASSRILEETSLVLRSMTKIHLLANGMMTGCGMMKNIGNWRML
nr:toxin C-terminal domain-containing protein [Neisseria meningitidis]